jgi:Rrf2 family iron-sulfur cluster assembly transcriptional regulator
VKFSSRSQYAITAMLELSIQPDSSSVTLHEIARQQNISLSYLEQLFASLRKNGLVKGRRGPGGGYTLARSPDQISIADIITAVDQADTNFEANTGVEDTGNVTSDLLWQHLSNKIRTYLSSINLEQFVHIANNANNVSNALQTPSSMQSGVDLSRKIG